MSSKLIFFIRKDYEPVIREEVFDSAIENIEFSDEKVPGWGEQRKIEITFSEDLTSIGSEAIRLSKNGELDLSQLIIILRLPNPVKSFKGDSFKVYSLETSLYNDQGEIIIDGVLIRKKAERDAKQLLITEGIVEIAADFQLEKLYMNDVKKISLPSTLKRVGKKAFNGARSLTSVKFPKALEEIGEYAFSGCAISTLTIPDSVKAIRKGAFSNCSNLKKIKIGKGTEIIEDGAFAFTSSLEKIEGKFAECENKLLIVNGCLNCVTVGLEGDIKLPDNIERIAPGAFTRENNIRFLILPSGIKVLETRSLEYCHLEKLIIPESVEKIEEGFREGAYIQSFEGKFVSSYFVIDGNILLAAANTDPEKEIKIPENITVIGRSFLGGGRYGINAYINGLVFPSALTKIGAKAFEGAGNIKLSALPENLEEIDFKAFSYTKNDIFENGLFIIPSNVNRIGLNAFSSPYGVHQRDIWMLPVNPPEFDEKETLRDITLFVEENSVPKYKEALPNLTGKIEIWEK